MFASRHQAGVLLATRLLKQRCEADLIVGIARGGVVVAQAIAEMFALPLDVLVVKKIGAPLNPELAIGALAPDGITYIDERLIQQTRTEKDYLKKAIFKVHKLLKDRELLLRQGRSSLDVKHKKVILVDDGVATGATVFVSVKWLRQMKAQTIILAIPVASIDIVEKLTDQVDASIIYETPADFSAVGQFYRDFHEVSDEEIQQILEKYQTSH